MAIGALILTACGGFLLAVLWMDLMFDVQVLKYRGSGADLPEPVLASIAAYYARVTTGARPMSHLIALVMLICLVTVVGELVVDRGGRVLHIASLILVGVPILLALLRVVRNAIRLGRRVDPPSIQSALARAICRDHLICLAGVLGFIALQLFAAVA